MNETVCKCNAKRPCAYHASWPENAPQFDPVPDPHAELIENLRALVKDWKYGGTCHDDCKCLKCETRRNCARELSALIEGAK